MRSPSTSPTCSAIRSVWPLPMRTAPRDGIALQGGVHVLALGISGRGLRDSGVLMVPLLSGCVPYSQLEVPAFTVPFCTHFAAERLVLADAPGLMPVP
jgi:hypothetical protein